MLDLQIARRANNEKHLSKFDMMGLLPILKKEEEYAWLQEVSAQSLTLTCALLDGAYQSFFKKRARFPKYKSRKKSKPVYSVANQRLYFDGNYVHVQKLG